MKSTRDLTYTLHKVVFLLDKIADDVLQQELKLSFSQFKILMAIDHTTVCQREIASYWDMTEAAVSRQVELLLESKLVIRKENEENRRQYELSLSPKGKEYLEKGFTFVDEKYNEYYYVINEKERQVLVEGLHKLLKVICKGNDKGECVD